MWLKAVGGSSSAKSRKQFVLKKLITKTGLYLSNLVSEFWKGFHFIDMKADITFGLTSTRKKLINIFLSLRTASDWV